MRALVIEDYQPLRNGLVRALAGAGWAVDAAGDGEEGLFLAKANAYDAVVLDLMLPRIDGLEVLRRLRAAGNACHVLILTARDAVEDRIRGLDAGADDYLAKPFDTAELLARLRALVRRSYARKDPLLRVGDLVLDTAARQAKRGETALDLTPREYALLELLALRAGSVVAREELWEHLYRFDDTATSNVLDVFISHLRRKLEVPGLPRLLHTRRGEGYLLGEAAP